MDTTFKESAITPTLGEVKPIDIFSLKRRKTDEKIVTDLAKAVARDGGYSTRPQSATKARAGTSSSTATTGLRHGSAAAASRRQSGPTSTRRTRPTR